MTDSPKEGDTVTWTANKMRGKVTGIVMYTEGFKVRIKIPWKTRKEGHTMVWKDISELEIVSDQGV